MTRVLSAVLAPHDINVNCVCPGGVATDMLREVSVAYGKLVDAPPDDVFSQLISSQLQRHIEPIEVARTISFLLSDDAIIIRGQAVSADGGDTPILTEERNRWADRRDQAQPRAPLPRRSAQLPRYFSLEDDQP